MRQIYEAKWDLITLHRKLTHKNIALKRYNGKRILSGQEGNDYLSLQIKSSAEGGVFCGTFWIK